ncbi:hypothetical protein GCM10009785_30970 [Brooklawnia cerclae]|uniref:Multimeric flavodoxin WrbA n=1 Tax=Brooklawnia cerclae TaxID=349934 RepID=A0ABX0SDZ6_9ACTN|nr:flavodoxin family protein [Brooklawnia cerclae]NIH56612.1 multimeric flavodoxin WrbA [Brooklawnia cerclae]
MKVVVVYATARRGSTYHVSTMLLDMLSATEQLEIEQIRLPREAPDFCTGCYLCFNEGGERCPHVDTMEPIEEKLHAADLIVLCSPVYAGGVAGQLKTVFDHLSYSELMHKPHPSMFSKVVVSIVLSAGKGHRTTARYIARCFADLGISSVFAITGPVAADSWAKVTDKRRDMLTRRADDLVPRIVAAVRSPKVSMRTKFFFHLSRWSIKKWGWNESDVSYWQRQGWLGSGRPWKQVAEVESWQGAPLEGGLTTG